MRRFFLISWAVLLVILVVLPTLLGRVLGTSPSVKKVDGSDDLPVKVYFPDTNQIREIALGEYLKGVVAAEMPPEFELEALKAQMIVARTYTVRRMQHFNGAGNGGCRLNKQADVCADAATSQAYLSKEELVEKEGTFSALNYWRRLEETQAQTAGLVLGYQEDLIDPLYHSVSGRLTEDSGAYFSQSLPYLQPVSDEWGADAPNLVQTRSFKLDEVAKKLGIEAIPASNTSGSPLIEVVAKTPTDRVKAVRVGGKVVSGRDFREKLSLRSTDFTVSVEQESVVVTTHGYGHGVGMSQYGANGMAKAGKSYDEILRHYYAGVHIRHLFGE